MGILTVLVRLKAAENPSIPLKGCALIYSLPGICCELQQMNDDSKVIKNLKEETELCVFRVKTKEKTNIVSVLNPAPLQSAHECHLSCVEPSSHTVKSESALAC